ncbi:MAG TPA: tetratricopeptide repeat protein [Stellaceae bacterium]|nr:tetratricopeptide repeat protein [Stellaceae bacterium]
MAATRRLTAILAADVAGYSRLIGEDEEGTLAALKAIRREIVDPAVTEHRGRIVKTTGDGVLVEFASVVDALRCAVAWQAAAPAETPITWRIGIHQGDIVVEEGDIFGDGVNIAARLESLAEPGGICVSARVQEDAAGRLGLAFEDLGEQTLKNISRPVRVYRVAPGVRPKTVSTAPPALPEKPSIAVLPFQNLSGDPEQEYFVDGMVEEIITALSRIRWLFVIARNSSFTYKGQAVEVKRIGHQLGVRYVLEGSVRKAGGRVRIMAQLVEAESSAILWAERFDGSLEDVFDLQDKVASSAAGIIEPALQAAEVRRSTSRPVSDPTTYDLYLRALPLLFSFSRGGVVTALELLEQAVGRDPDYGPALAAAAICRMHTQLNTWSGDWERNRSAGIDYGRRALAAGAGDAGTLANAAYALAYFGEEIGAMIGIVDRALTLNPSFARGWYLLGWMRMWAGDAGSAIEPLQAASRLSPRARVGDLSLALGATYFMLRRFDDALPRFLMAIQESPGNPAVHRWLAACYAHMGRLTEAREAIERLRATTPVLLPVAPQWRTPECRELFQSGFRLAMDEATRP